MNIFKKAYHYYAPYWVKKIYRGRMFSEEYKKFLENGVEENCEKETEYIKNSRWVPVIPYKWSELYAARDYKMHKDGKGFFVEIDKKKLYLPRNDDGGYSEGIARVMAEQDRRSPHLYFDNNVCVNQDSVLFDIGAAEGLITLLNIDRVKKAYVFECDDEWIGALQKTFEPYGDKVSIINKFVSDVNDDNNTTLEVFLNEHTEDTVILKMDIEGMETAVVEKGLGCYMGATNIKFSCCTYHHANDATTLQNLFGKYGYKTEFTEGHILFMNEKPYFRKGIIRAWK